jgi:hypothetical protein
MMLHAASEMVQTRQWFLKIRHPSQLGRASITIAIPTNRVIPDKHPRESLGKTSKFNIQTSEKPQISMFNTRAGSAFEV